MSHHVRWSLIALVTSSLLATVPGVVLAAQPSPGTFSGGCPEGACTLSLNTTKHKITSLSYTSSKCGGVSNSPVSIPVSKKGTFSYSPPPPPLSFAVSVVLKGKFVTSGKATGKITVLNYESGKSKPTCQQTAHFTIKKS